VELPTLTNVRDINMSKDTKEQNNVLQFEVVKNVTLPLLKPQLDVPVYIKVLDPIYLGKKVEQDKEPATIANIVNLETGEHCQILVPAVLAGIFEDEYPDNAYVNKCFKLTKHPKASGKRYHLFTVLEITVK